MLAIRGLRDISAFQHGVCAVDRRPNADQVAADDRVALPHDGLVPQLHACRRRPASVRVLLRTAVHHGATHLLQRRDHRDRNIL